MLTARKALHIRNRVSTYGDRKLKPSPMGDGLWALVVYDAEEPVRAVERILLDQGISTRRVRNCSAAGAALCERTLPSLVLTDTALPDGGWVDVLKATLAVLPSPPVIVVSRVVDIKLYLDALEGGAYDFVVPPLSPADLAHIVSGALAKARPYPLQALARPGRSSA